MSDFGIKVSRPGYDVLTADDVNLVLSSGFNTFKSYKIIYFSAAGSEAHGLDYSPTFDFVRDHGSGEWVFGNGGYWEAYAPVVSVDDTTVYTTEKAYVILYIDPLNE